jgi:small-conductance mechanosensitive channel
MHDAAHDLAAQVEKLAWLPAWAQSLLLGVIALLIALAAHGIGLMLAHRLLKTSDAFWRALAARTRGPVRLTLVTLALSLAVAVAPLTHYQSELLKHVLLIAFILLMGWITLVAMDIAAALYLRGFRTDVEDNLLARKHLTQIRILKRAAAILVGVVTVALALMTISSVRQWGVSLLAAGGAAGVIVGLALQPLLTNLVAGIQIAMTQPIRIDDAVIVEGEWGWIEEITAAYVVVRLWDWRRMILPLSYFIQKPFQNWTRESSALIGTSMIYVDFTAPVAAMRAQLEIIAKASPLWDGKVVNLAVTDLKDKVMEVRCLISARNAGQTFDLRCEVREKMMDWLAREHPQALPRDRVEFERGDAPAVEPR